MSEHSAVAMRLARQIARRALTTADHVAALLDAPIAQVQAAFRDQGMALDIAVVDQQAPLGCPTCGCGGPVACEAEMRVLRTLEESVRRRPLIHYMVLAANERATGGFTIVAYCREPNDPPLVLAMEAHDVTCPKCIEGLAPDPAEVPSER